MNMPYLRPFFTFYGGKWNMAPYYPSPTFKTIVEPFAGSAGFSLNHYKRDVILIEKDPAIASIWEFLISSTPKDIMNLPDLFLGQHIDDLDVPYGARCLIGFWCGRGRSQPAKTISGWGHNPKYSKYFWGSEAKKRIASQVECIKHWRVVHDNYDVDLGIQSATWFIDPPYQFSGGRSYRWGSDNICFKNLSNWCRSRKGQVIVCEGQYANWMPFSYLTTSNGNNGRSHVEMIWTNKMDQALS